MRNARLDPVERVFLVLGLVFAAVVSVIAIAHTVALPPAPIFLTVVFIASVAAASAYRIPVGTTAQMPSFGGAVALLVLVIPELDPLVAVGLYAIGVFASYVVMLRRAALGAYAAGLGAASALVFVVVYDWLLDAAMPVPVDAAVASAAYVATLLVIEFARRSGRWARDGGVGFSGLRPLALLTVWVVITAASVVLAFLQSAILTGSALSREAALSGMLAVAIAAVFVVLALVRRIRTLTRQLRIVLGAAVRLPWEDVENPDALLVDLVSDAVGDAEVVIGQEPSESGDIEAPLTDDGSRRLLVSRPVNAQAFDEGDRRVVDALAHIERLVVRSRADLRDLRRRARTDGLTGLSNYRTFHEALTTANAMRGYDDAMAVLYVDLDDFKTVNDRYGHGFGDEVLTHIVRTFVESVRPDDLVARVGGDEFAIILSKLSSLEQAELIAERIIENASRPIEIGSVHLTPGLSVGLAYSEHREEDVSRLVDDADRTMLTVKRRGKERGNDERKGNLGISKHRSSHLNDLVARAVAEESFTLAYQPIVSLVDRRIWAFEALVRVTDDVGGGLAPAEFVEAVARLGLLDEFTRVVTRKALVHATGFRAICPEITCVAVNIDADQVLPAQLGSFFTEIAEEFDDLTLCLELNERSVAVVSDELRSELERLRGAGILIALDDYGAVHSSVDALVRVPMDVLKIDRSLIGDLADVRFVEVVRAMQSFGDSLDYALVVEGVEDAAAADLLASIGVRSAQGFLYGQPASAAGTAERLRRSGSVAVRVP